MVTYALMHPTATIARGIENMVIANKNRSNLVVKIGCCVLMRAISLTAFPIILGLELALKRIPKFIISAVKQEKFSSRYDKVVTYALALLCTPLGLRSPEAVTGFFLKRRAEQAVRPFGVEELYGKEVDALIFPKTVEELQEIVKNARAQGKTISVIGAGMSQGTQTVPQDDRHIVIHTKHLNKIEVNPEENTATVGSGTTWEELQVELNHHHKSAIVKQASDIFSIGGSIGINCHGWAHEYGAISSTVRELKVINAEGELLTLKPDDELFGCFFGTLGYFGIIVEATLDIVENETLIRESTSVSYDQFVTSYKTEVKAKDIPLFGARLSLDATGKNTPLSQVCMVTYKRAPEAQIEERDFTFESKLGRRIERIALQLIAQLSNFSVTRLTSWFWHHERAQVTAPELLSRNEALHPPINAFKMLHHSNLHTQWLQEYFVTEDQLSNFLDYLGSKLKANNVRLINATIRPTPKDNVSILPYAEQDRYAVVICFAQKKSAKYIAQTQKWIEEVNKYLTNSGGVYYQAYMPYATREQFETCYGSERVDHMRKLKEKYDPSGVFGNAHTAKYFDTREEKNELIEPS